MKKMYLVLIAVVMAFSFSAFTVTGKQSSLDEVTYQDDNLDWQVFQGTPCPGDQIPECIKMTEHGLRQLYYDRDLSRPVKRNAP